jgi:hypothetical protein
MTRRFKTAKEYVSDCLLYYTEDIPKTENYSELLTILAAIEQTATDCRHYIYEQIAIENERKKNG